MTREARRGLRASINIIHIAVQAILMWIIMETHADAKAATEGELIRATMFTVQMIGMMIGAFCISWTATKMLSHTHSEHR